MITGGATVKQYQFDLNVLQRRTDSKLKIRIETGQNPGLLLQRKYAILFLFNKLQTCFVILFR